jgi:hypothetical protein
MLKLIRVGVDTASDRTAAELRHHLLFSSYPTELICTIEVEF